MCVGEHYFRALWFDTGEKETTFTLSEGSTILGDLIKLRMHMVNQIGLKSTISGACLWNAMFMTVRHVILNTGPSLVFSCK